MYAAHVSTRPIKLLLVDDHEVVRVGLHAILSRDPAIDIVGEAATAETAIAKAARLQPDVILLDIQLPDGQGIDVCRTILSDFPGARVLFLTAYTDDDTVIASIVAGAHGYLLKEIGAEALLRSIKLVASGQSILDPTVTGRVLDWMRSLQETTATKAKSNGLSPQEQRIVALIAEGQTNKEIAAELGLSAKTVKNYLATIFQKLKITRRAQAVAFVSNHSS